MRATAHPRRPDRNGRAVFPALALVLAACTSPESTLDIAGANAQFPDTGGATQEAALPAGTARVHFAPIVGAPVDKVTALSRQLSADAQAAQVRLEPSASTAIEHEIRGYFSAFSDNGETTVIHVWDVFAPDGRRVHRIQGQEKVPGEAPDPWSIVPPELMARIAAKVIADYRAFRAAPAAAPAAAG